MKCTSLIFLFALLAYSADAQLTDGDRDQIRRASERLIKHYFNVKREAAFRLKQRSEATTSVDGNRIKGQIDSLYQRKLGKDALVEPNARVYISCRKNGKNIASTSRSFREFLNFRYFTSAEAVDYKDVCVAEYWEAEKKVIVKFKSKFEVDEKYCKPRKDGFHHRLAYLRYWRVGGAFKVSFLSIEFEGDKMKCTEEPLALDSLYATYTSPSLPPSQVPSQRPSTSEPTRALPSISFLAPQSGAGTTEEEVFSISANITGVEAKDEIQLLLNGVVQKKFNFRRGQLKQKLALLPGRNVINILAKNSAGQAVESATISYENQQSFQLPQVSLQNRLGDTVRNLKVLQLSAVITGLRTEDEHKLYCIANGKVYDRRSLQFSRGSLQAEVPLQQGENHLVVVAANEHGVHYDDFTLVVLGQLEKPSITITHPLTDIFSDKQRISDTSTYITAIVREVERQEDIEVLVDGKKIDFDFDPQLQLLSTGLFELNTRIDGANTNVRIIAKNSSGKSTKEHLRFRYHSPCASVSDSLSSCRARLVMVIDDLKKCRTEVKRLRREKLSLQYTNSKLEAENKKIRREVHDSTLFIGLNFSLVSRPFQTPLGNLAQYDPIDRAGRSVNLSSFGFSIYYLVGAWLGNIQRSKSTLPEYHYTQWQVDEISRRFDRDGVAYRPLQYESTQANLFTINFGCYVYTYLKPVPLYLMIGLSHAKGEVWNNFSGEYNDALNRNADATYAIDLQRINTQKPILGLAYVQKFLQVEAGYDFLYEDYFLNVGANLPLFDLPTKHFYLKRSRRIP
ncbi:MAG: hypothetical protein AAFW73_09400 [Bacteroidota bacterium]